MKTNVNNIIEQVKECMIENITITSDGRYGVELKGFECIGWDCVFSLLNTFNLNESEIDNIIDESLKLANEIVNNNYQQTLNENY